MNEELIEVIKQTIKTEIRSCLRELNSEEREYLYRSRYLRSKRFEESIDKIELAAFRLSDVIHKFESWRDPSCECRYDVSAISDIKSAIDDLKKK